MIKLSLSNYFRGNKILLRVLEHTFSYIKILPHTAHLFVPVLIVDIKSYMYSKKSLSYRYILQSVLLNSKYIPTLDYTVLYWL